MAVAVKTTPETAPQQPLNRLAVGSLAETIYVFASLALIFYVLPILWDLLVSPALAAVAGMFVDRAMLGLVMLGTVAGLGFLGVRLVGGNQPHGLRAGIFCGLLGTLCALLLTQWLGKLLESVIYQTRIFGSSGRLVGMGVSAAVGLALLGLVVFVFFRSRFDHWLAQIENQGWFSTAAYKRLQGQRVRRGTILAILVLAASGIYTLQSHHTLDAASEGWAVRIPYTGTVSVTEVAVEVAGDTSLERGAVVDRFALRDLNDQLTSEFVRISSPGDSKFRKAEKVPRREYDAEVFRLRSENRIPPTFAEPIAGTTAYQTLTLLPHIAFTLPMLLTAAALWLSYRLVNFPVFADFLIATEAELNKVSWTTRKRLVQDTIVVLTTMLLLTGFLFIMDSIWIKVLSFRWIDVLQTERVDTGDIDAQIEKLSQERDAAVAEGKDSQKVTDFNNRIESLNRQRESIIRGKQGGPQEW